MPEAGQLSNPIRLSRSGITDHFQRIVQAMCDARRRSHGSSTCELCDDPCDDPESIASARVALALGATADLLKG